MFWQSKRKNLDIFTICTGREDYLAEQFQMLKAHRGVFRNHIFVCNGYRPSEQTARWLRRLGSVVHRFDERLPVGACIEGLKHHFTAEHTMKLDDDALPLGERFFDHLHALRELLPRHVFSPFPIGLLGNRGGPAITPGREHDVLYSASTKTYYTLRPVRHVGGFARIAPSSFYRDFAFNIEGHSEDAEFSSAMNKRGVSMVYVENAFVVDHAETSLGQKKRNPAYDEMKAANKVSRQMPAKAAQQ